MGQTRLHVTAVREAAEKLYAALDQAFEDDGFPLAMIELDEARRLHEVSLYVSAGDVERGEAHMRKIAASLDPGLVVEAEALPDIDWVARSLEGLKPVRAGRFFVHGSHDRALRPASRIAIEIEA